MLRALFQKIFLLNLLFFSSYSFAVKVETLGQLSQEFVSRGFVGTVLAKKGDQILFQKAFGYADYSKQKLNTLDTRFAVGSATKQLVAASVLLLQERGLLSVNDTLEKLLSEYNFPWASKVTLHHLLTHTSGIFNYTDTPKFFEYVEGLGKNVTLNDLVKLFNDKPLNFEPGSDWDYSNSGFLLAGIIVEKYSGKSLGDFLRTEIFEKLGMKNSSYEPFEWSSENAMPHSFNKDYNPEFFDPPYMIWANAAGGVMSTVSDWSLWLNFLHHGGRVLSDASLNLMKSPLVKTSWGDFYGYGLMIGEDLNRKMIGHGGDMPGFHFSDIYYLEDDLQVIVATNQEPSKVRSIMAGSLAELLLKGSTTLMDFRSDVKIPSSTLEKLKGSFEGELNANGQKVLLAAVVFLENEKLYIQLKGQGPLWLIAQTDSFFVLKDIATVEFSSQNEFILTQGGQKIVFRRK